MKLFNFLKGRENRSLTHWFKCWQQPGLDQAQARRSAWSPTWMAVTHRLPGTLAVSWMVGPSSRQPGLKASTLTWRQPNWLFQSARLCHPSLRLILLAAWKYTGQLLQSTLYVITRDLNLQSWLLVTGLRFDILPCKPQIHKILYSPASTCFMQSADMRHEI